jgi:hypothetical protein
MHATGPGPRVLLSLPPLLHRTRMMRNGFKFRALSASLLAALIFIHKSCG